MNKLYVLDTSALINDPFAYKKFNNSTVIIPIIVLSELDKLKKQSAEAGKHARVAIRALDEICSLGDISVGILLEDNILLKVDVSYKSDNEYPEFGDPDYGDTKILKCAYSHYLTNDTTTLVSNDINLRVKAQAFGMFAEEHKSESVSLSDLYSGNRTINNEEAGEELLHSGFINIDDHQLDLFPNECVSFTNEDGEIICMGRKVDDNKVAILKKVYPWSIAGRNKEQSFAIDLIMDPNVDLITLIGQAGTGKSLIVLASALELVLNKKKYEKLIIYRPIQPVGNDIGYLPGTQEEKLAPWFQAIMDNFEILFSTKNTPEWRKNLEMYQKKGRIEMEAITYIRGRSIPNAIILVDECQNLSKEEVKTILTRAGENTKVILTGDIEQIDNSFLDASDNGLTYVIEKFKESDMAGHVTFIQGERSRLASEAAKIL